MARVLSRARRGLPIAFVLAFLISGCASAYSSVPARTLPTATPTPARAAGAAWVQGLAFAGDVQGAMDHVVPDSASTRSECSGRNSRPAGAWASALYGPVGQEVFEVLTTVRPYHGPGTYRAPDVLVQVARPDGSAVWETSDGDVATFTVGVDEESGTVSATLTNLATTATKLRLDGRWSCRT